MEKFNSSLYGRNFLTIKDFSTNELKDLIYLAHQLKIDKQNNYERKFLRNKKIIAISNNEILQSKVAFELAAFEQGAYVTYLDEKDCKISNNSNIETTAKILSTFYDGVQIKGVEHNVIEKFAKYSTIPIWNGLTNKFHPTQILADYLTIYENGISDFTKCKVVYIGNGQTNLFNSYLLMAMKLGIDFRFLAPKILWPNKKIIQLAQKIAKKTGAKFILTQDYKKAVNDVDVIATDGWANYESIKYSQQLKIEILEKYQINPKLLKNAKNNYILLNPLISLVADFQELNYMKKNNLMNMKTSKIYEQLENNIHSIKAILVGTIGERF